MKEKDDSVKGGAFRDYRPSLPQIQETVGKRPSAALHSAFVIAAYYIGP